MKNKIFMTFGGAIAALCPWVTHAGVCTYDGDIRTPTKAITKPGKTFKGWKFNKAN